MGFRTQLVTPLAAAGLRRRVAWVVHEIVPATPFGRAWRLSARRAHAIFTYSSAAASQPLLRETPVRALGVRLPIDGCLTVALPRTPVRRLGLVGDLLPIKNHLAFIEVVHRLRAAGIDVEGLMIGRGAAHGIEAPPSYVERVHAAIRDADGVTLLAATPADMPLRLKAVDILLHLTTVPESFGRVFVEAMAAGRPVVAFDHGAVSEIVEDGVTGILCPPGDLVAVQHAVMNLCEDPALFRRFSEAARAHAKRRWGPETREETIGDALVRFARGDTDHRERG